MELTTALRSIKAGRLLVMLDSCHSGALGDPRDLGTEWQAGFSARSLISLVEGEGRVILSASRPDELAWEFSGMRNGLFTHYLLEALNGAAARADGTVWVSDLFGYVSRCVRRHRYQRPFQNAIGEDFVVIVARPEIRIERGRGTEPSPNPQQLRRFMHAKYDRNELALLCHDLGLRLDDLTGSTLETQILALIDHCQRHGRYDELVVHITNERPTIAAELPVKRPYTPNALVG
jgi:uncharacterized caspase-like protein